VWQALGVVADSIRVAGLVAVVHLPRNADPEFFSGRPDTVLECSLPTPFTAYRPYRVGVRNDPGEV
jgi:hypothetical protein